MHELSFLLHSYCLRLVNHLSKFVLQILKISFKRLKWIINLREPHIWLIPRVLLAPRAMLQFNLVLSFKSLFRGHRRIRLFLGVVVWVRITSGTSYRVMPSGHVYWLVIHEQSLFLYEFVQRLVGLNEYLNVSLCIHLFQAWRKVFRLKVYTLTKFVHEARKTIHFLLYEIYLVFISGLDLVEDWLELLGELVNS